MASPEEQVSAEIDKEIKLALDNGTAFDEDSGVCLGHLTEHESAAEAPLTILPAKISLYFNGYWYIYKMDTKVEAQKEEKEDGDKEIKQG